MNKKILLLLPSCLLLTGCPGLPILEEGECEVVNGPDVCTGSETNPKIGITLVRDGVRVGPPNVCANAGTTIEVSIQPPQKDLNTVRTVPKDPEHAWLNASNSSDKNSFEINVPASATVGEDYFYTIIRSNGTCLDPRVHVDP